MRKKLTINEIHVGMKVLAIDSGFKGLEGEIIDIKKGDEKETDNDSILDIYVAFDEPYNLKETHAHLFDTWSFPDEVIPPSLDSVIMAEDMLAYYQYDEDELPITLEGQYVCIDCITPLDYVTEIQHDFIEWRFKDGEYIKYDDDGGTDYKRCPYCNIRIDDDNMTMFPY